MIQSGEIHRISSTNHTKCRLVLPKASTVLRVFWIVLRARNKLTHVHKGNAKGPLERALSERQLLATAAQLGAEALWNHSFPAWSCYMKL